MSPLLWLGAAAPALFVLTFLVDGATRPGYSARRQPVSALALGRRGWVQTTSFVLTGALVVVGAFALPAAVGTWFASIPLAVFGLALVASGVYRMDPMRGYPPGTPDTTPDEYSRAHRRHDTAGAVVFTALPVAALVAALTLADTGWRWYSGITSLALFAGFALFGQAWEEDSPTAGLLQRVMIVVGWTWVTLLFVYAAT
jgi:hypothetical protein